MLRIFSARFVRHERVCMFVACIIHNRLKVNKGVGRRWECVHSEALYVHTCIPTSVVRHRMFSLAVDLPQFQVIRDDGIIFSSRVEVRGKKTRQKKRYKVLAETHRISKVELQYRVCANDHF